MRTYSLGLSWVWSGVVLIGASALVVSLAARQPAPVDAVDAVPTAKRVLEPVRYGRDIRPILSDRCFQCHGPDAGTLAADLRLDVRDHAIAARKDGPPAIVPGDAASSELFRRIASSDPMVRMPPPESHKNALTAAEQDLVRRWIDQGARYEAHWAFEPPVRPPVPERAQDWGTTPIDAFILQTLEQAGITPSPEADRVSQLRRLFFDLTGLAPTPDEIDEFLSDHRPDAYERWVDRLLTREPYRTRYAERMTAPWLDQARYADTTGIHMDAGRQMWLWRDWVLHAYRDNMPFDQFVIEQLAGDLIPGASTWQVVASGFNRNHVITDEGGAIDEEYLVEYAVDRVSTAGSVLLGLTLGCARCHDHKFDPISMEDFYSFFAFFNSNDEPGLYSQTPDANRAYEPFILVPTSDQQARLDAITREIEGLKATLETRTPEEQEQRERFAGQIQESAGVRWSPAHVVSVTSNGGATMDILDDGSIRASGTLPERDDYHVTIRTSGSGQRLILLEALEEPTAPDGRIGRAHNGNVVVTGLLASWSTPDKPESKNDITFSWAYADYAQENGNFAVTNLLSPNNAEGWALRAHERRGPRYALLLADEDFGVEGVTDLHLIIRQQSIYAQHTLARFRISVGTISDVGADMLPNAWGRWHVVGPFAGDEQNRVWEPEIGPEHQTRLDLAATFGEQGLAWRFDERLRDGIALPLYDGRNITYLGRQAFAPTPRSVEVSLGSDDGFRLYANATQVAQRQVDRGVAPDQDSATIPLTSGENAVVLKIVNTGGIGGFYYKQAETATLRGDLVWALIPHDRLSAELESRLDRAWSSAFLPRYLEAAERTAALDRESISINAVVPRTMVMKELPEPRPTFVLSAGLYDKPDHSRPVGRRVPASLGAMPADAPANRLGLAEWIVSDDNPLLARVTMNRLWEQFFGTGIVETSDDFGLQGAWPSHPELLDYLAVEFRESGWDLQHMIRLIVTSATYRQSSRVRPSLKELDPDNRLLAFFPRRRLAAEQIRDHALYASGLLVEKLGGPSVKPYQPPGLWQEVAMPQSNTRIYQQGTGDDLWRRSIYTYWKRAVPPPSMLTFDAPTRESCVTRRIPTSTPLQALVLWNDEQFQEAYRVLAQRTLAEVDHDDARLTHLFRRCIGRAPEPRELTLLHDALEEYRARYRQAPDDAAGVIAAGQSSRPADADAAELAAWTMIASSVFNLYESTTQE
ncbi:MAG: PSD1 domain-containing protein [Phycisphaeraceae bacterium]|nr:PSD1 domain-containing protein [Phycisphaeraceae bacterium]MCW5764239.1 PSD1 domain-containing protein [Phycisphaeraceae bacterium]